MGRALRSPSVTRIRVAPGRRRDDFLVTVRWPRILLAEDDKEMRYLLASALRRRGYSVKEARDGDEALEQLGEMLPEADRPGGPDLLIADIRMPTFTGIDVLHALRLANQRLPVILITAFGDPQTHDEAARLGASAVLDKPFEIAELLAVVERAAPLR